jgi:hypothetical protein
MYRERKYIMSNGKEEKEMHRKRGWEEEEDVMEI